MKKFISSIVFLVAFVAIQAQVTAYNSNIDFPGGNAQRVILADTGINVITVHNTVVYAIQCNLETAADTTKANMTIDLSIGTGVKVGSLLYIELKSGARGTPYTIALRTGCFPVTITPTASKTKVLTLMYNGTLYRLIGNSTIN